MHSWIILIRMKTVQSKCPPWIRLESIPRTVALSGCARETIHLSISQHYIGSAYITLVMSDRPRQPPTNPPARIALSCTFVRDGLQRGQASKRVSGAPHAKHANTDSSLPFLNRWKDSSLMCHLVPPYSITFEDNTQWNGAEKESAIHPHNMVTTIDAIQVILHRPSIQQSLWSPMYKRHEKCQSVREIIFCSVNLNRHIDGFYFHSGQQSAHQYSA